MPDAEEDDMGWVCPPLAAWEETTVSDLSLAVLLFLFSANAVCGIIGFCTTAPFVELEDFATVVKAGSWVKFFWPFPLSSDAVLVEPELSSWDEESSELLAADVFDEAFVVAKAEESSVATALELLLVSTF